MKKYLLIMIGLTLLLTGCTGSNTGFDTSLTTYKREVVNVDETALLVGPVYLSKNNDSYIFIVNITLENDKVFESVLINQTITTIFKDYKIMLGFNNKTFEVFRDTSIWKKLTLLHYDVNYEITFIVDENDIPSDQLIKLDNVINQNRLSSPVQLSFYGVDEKLFYVSNINVELDK